jgi:hypothetical protein
VYVLDDKYELERARPNVPFENNFSRLLHLMLGSWPLYGAIFFFDRGSCVVFWNFGLGFLRSGLFFRWWIFTLHLYNLWSASSGVWSLVNTLYVLCGDASVC